MSIKHPDWAVTGIPRKEMRLHKTRIEILDATAQDAMRKVCRYAREVLDIVAAEAKPGVTTDYLDEVCHKACVEREVSPPSEAAPSVAERVSLTCVSVLPITTELPQLPQISLHVTK